MRQCVITVWVAILVGCGGPPAPRREASAPLSSSWQPPAVLAYVPADTPYLVAALEGTPRAWRDRMYAGFDDAMRRYMKTLDRSASTPLARAMLAVLDEMPDKDPRVWTQEIGLEPGGTFVFYGVSVWPVLRLAVSNPDKLRGVVTRALAASGWPVTEATLGATRYWRIDDDGVTGIAAIVGHEAIISVFPTRTANDIVPLALGATKPSHSLRDTKTVGDLMNRYGFLSSMVGFFDIRAIANIAAAASGPIAPACGTELDRLVGLVPRVAVGYKRLDASGAHFRAVFETPPNVASALARVRTQVPEVTAGISGHPLFAWGIAASLDDVIPLLRSVAKQVADAPFQCLWFQGLNRAAERVGDAVSKPLPPVFSGVRGMSFVVDRFTKEPLDVEAHLLLVGPHARDLITMLAAFVPPLSMLAVPPDGTPVALPLASLQLPPELTAHLAANAERLGLAVGTNTEARAAELMSEGAPRRSPLLSFSFDGNRLAEMDGMSETEKLQMRQMGDAVFQIDVSRDGIVTDMYVTFPP